MQIVCPNCAAAYEVPVRLLARRKSVRCARCGESWLPDAPAPESPEPTIVEPEPAPEPEIRPPPPRLPVVMPVGLNTEIEPYESVDEPRKLYLPNWELPKTRLLAAWAISIAVVLLFVVILVVDRRGIAASWPPMQRLYGWFGLM